MTVGDASCSFDPLSSQGILNAVGSGIDAVQRRLRALGCEIERGESGKREIKGYTREYLEAGSPRRRQIQEYLAKEDRRGAAASQIAAHQTRAAKVDLSHGQVVEAARGRTQYVSPNWRRGSNQPSRLRQTEITL